MIDLLGVTTAKIVAAYVSNNYMAPTDLPAFVGQVHIALHHLATGVPVPQSRKPVPAVPIKSSVTPDFIICLEDGARYKSLTRHLSAKYNLTPKQYREKWNLPASYPMVAANHRSKRSAFGLKSAFRRPETFLPSPAP